jgi:ketosteroid isomerase-like protein
MAGISGDRSAADISDGVGGTQDSNIGRTRYRQGIRHSVRCRGFVSESRGSLTVSSSGSGGLAVGVFRVEPDAAGVSGIDRRGPLVMSTFVTDLDREGEKRPFAAHGHAIIGSAGGMTLMKGTFEPGWRWTTDIAPIAGTPTCQTRHLGYVLSGRMHVKSDDGTDLDIGPGQLFDLPAGHDAWVLGDEPCVMVDVSPDVTRYARGGQQVAGAQDPNIALVRKGYAAFNSGDVDTLRSVLARDAIQHVPGDSDLAGEYKGIDAVLSYYAKIGEMTQGSFRADLIEAHGDGRGHVTALHQTTATRNGVTRVSRGSILFTFMGEKATDLLELHADLAGDDAFFA